MPMLSINKNISRREFLKVMGFAACSGAAGYVYSFEYSSNNIELTSLELPIKNLAPTFDNFTITQISDLHCDKKNAIDRLGQAVDIVNAEKSDIVVITGDYFTSDEEMKKHLWDCGNIISNIKSRYGVFSVMGNHDYWVNYNILRSMLEKKGVEILDNRNVAIKKDGKSFSLVGLASLWMGKMDTAKAFLNIPNIPKIVVTHNPDTAIYIDQYDPDIMICGHTHGGQIRIPLYGPVVNYTRIGKKYAMGLNKYKNTMMYTNRGIGTYWIDARFYCLPEISTFILKSPKVV